MFITPAFAATVATATTAAATAPAATGASDAAAAGLSVSSYVPMVLVLLVFYLMIIRPQSKRAAEHRGMINALQKGDKVITGGGLIAKVTKLVGEDEVLLELAEGVQVTALRSTIMAKKD